MFLEWIYEKNPEGLSSRQRELQLSFLLSSWGEGIPMDSSGKAFSKQGSRKSPENTESQMSYVKMHTMEGEVGWAGQNEGGSTSCMLKELFKTKLIAWPSNYLIAGCPSSAGSDPFLTPQTRASKQLWFRHANVV